MYSEMNSETRLKKPRVGSAVSLIAGISFAVFMLLVMGIITGCDSESVEPNTSVATAEPAPVPIRVEPVEIPEPEPPALRVVSFEEANFAYRNGDFDGATRLFKSYSEVKSENPWGHYMLGISATRIGNFELAETAFDRAIQIDPTHQKSRLNLARLLLKTDRSELALDNIEVAQESEIITAEVFRMRGRALHALGRTSEAEDAYREAIRIDNTDTWAMNNLALILLEEGFEELAIPPLARATELNPEESTFHNNLGMALEKAGQYRDAEASYARAIGANTSHQNALANLARIELVDQDTDTPQLDLVALAADFEEEITTWSDEVIDRELPIAVAISDSSRVSALVSDSTAVKAQE